jgi:hypothetical protein
VNCDGGAAEAATSLAPITAAVTAITTANLFILLVLINRPSSFHPGLGERTLRRESMRVAAGLAHGRATVASRDGVIRTRTKMTMCVCQVNEIFGWMEQW